MREHPELNFGEHLLESLELDPAKSLFATMEQPWQLAAPRLGFKPAHVVYVQSMEQTELDRIGGALPDFDVVVGLGGGSCIDFAKYFSWKREARLILIPSIASVDACVTRQVAVREGGRVSYVGDVQAERLLIDYSLISAAPARLNRAGSADILSIHTGSFDWLLGHKKTGEPHDDGIAQRGAEAVEDLEKHAPEICSVSHTGIRKLIELFEVENDLCLEHGNSRPEEGSEHFFAYNAERITGKHFIHGEIVCLGILLMSRLQNNLPEWVKSLLDELGVLYRPSDIGLELDELRQTLVTLADYCREEKFPHTIIYEVGPSIDTVERLISDL